MVKTITLEDNNNCYQKMTFKISMLRYMRTIIVIKRSLNEK